MDAPAAPLLDGPEAPPPRLTVRKYSKRQAPRTNNETATAEAGPPTAGLANVGGGSRAVAADHPAAAEQGGGGAEGSGAEDKAVAPKKKRRQTKARGAFRRDEGRWLERFEQLRSFRDANGNCNVPQKYPANPSLARWVSQQRVEYKKLVAGTESSITRERVGALDAVGFEWNALDAAWSRKFDDLRRFRASHGHCNVPLRHKEDPSLGRWVVRQRHERRNMREKKPTQLTEGRVASLEGLGFEWETLDKAWERRLAELASYREQHGHCDVPYVYDENRQLGHWVRNQRTQFSLRRAGKRHRLTEYRLNKLENLGFSWCATSSNDGPGGDGDDSSGEENGGAGKQKGAGEDCSSEDDEGEGAFGEMLSVDDEVRKPFASSAKKKIRDMETGEQADLSVDDGSMKLSYDGNIDNGIPGPSPRKYGVGLKGNSASERLSVDSSINSPSALMASFSMRSRVGSITRNPAASQLEVDDSVDKPGKTATLTVDDGFTKPRNDLDVDNSITRPTPRKYDTGLKHKGVLGRLGLDNLVDKPPATTAASALRYAIGNGKRDQAALSVRQRFEEEQLGVDDNVDMPGKDGDLGLDNCSTKLGNALDTHGSISRMNLYKRYCAGMKRKSAVEDLSVDRGVEGPTATMRPFAQRLRIGNSSSFARESYEMERLEVDNGVGMPAASSSDPVETRGYESESDDSDHEDDLDEGLCLDSSINMPPPSKQKNTFRQVTEARDCI
uniref:Helicase-associated domain-containing protein n=1 Tax=Odontella aurita TaxID=265563 RepID=A0A7S4MDK8_9STRA